MQLTSRNSAWILLWIFVAALMLRPLGLEAGARGHLAGTADSNRPCCCKPTQQRTLEASCCASSEAPATPDSQPSGCDCRMQPGQPSGSDLWLASSTSAEAPRLKELARVARRQLARDNIGLDSRALEGVARAGPSSSSGAPGDRARSSANPHAGLLLRRGTRVGLANFGIDRS